MQDEYFCYGTFLKDIDEPDHCPECQGKRILMSPYEHIPMKKTTHINYSKRLIYMCNSCGCVLGIVKQGADPGMHSKTFTDSDHGERYSALHKGPKDE